ncbi:hypothetical protein B0H14DRAFT_3470799 [Mycena olivaceomarginata]|nr:hypothetical protein B0H14DRAFT_3470799 [Mycena olivaceomarginata]
MGRHFAEAGEVGEAAVAYTQVATATGTWTSLPLRDAEGATLDRIFVLFGGTNPLGAQRFCLAEELRVFIETTWDITVLTGSFLSINDGSATILHHPPSYLATVVRPDSRPSGLGERLQVESAWIALAQGCDGEDDSAAEITFVNDIDVEEIPPSLHGGPFVYLEDRYGPAGTPPFEFYPDSATPLTDAKAFMFCHCKQCDEFDRCCQDMDSDLRFAYTDGLFNFTYGPDDVVVELYVVCLSFIHITLT